MTVALEAVETPDVSPEARRGLRELWRRAFGDRFTEDDADHAFGGVHVLARDAHRIIGHASAVPRAIRFGERPWLEIGYVEAVAVDPDWQARGVGRQVMERLHPEIDRRWPVAMLSTGRATGFYERLGWERRGGVSSTRTASGTVPDDEHGGLMIRRPERAVVPDLSVAATCEDRRGDAW